MSGRQFASKTDWLLSYQYKPRMDAGACKVESVTTKLALSSANCGALDSAMRARFDQLREQGRARDRDYDQQTGHGKTQDAVFR